MEDDLDIYVNRVVEEQLPTGITKEMMQQATNKVEVLQCSGWRRTSRPAGAGKG